MMQIVEYLGYKQMPMGHVGNELPESRALKERRQKVK